MSTRLLTWSAIVVTACVLLLLAAMVAGPVGLVVVALLGSCAALVTVRVRLGHDERPVRPAGDRSWALEPFHTYRRIGFLVLWNAARANPLPPGS